MRRCQLVEIGHKGIILRLVLFRKWLVLVASHACLQRMFNEQRAVGRKRLSVRLCLAEWNEISNWDVLLRFHSPKALDDPVDLSFKGVRLRGFRAAWLSLVAIRLKADEPGMPRGLTFK
jgi:hypothetical protein